MVIVLSEKNWKKWGGIICYIWSKNPSSVVKIRHTFIKLSIFSYMTLWLSVSLSSSVRLSRCRYLALSFSLPFFLCYHVLQFFIVSIYPKKIFDRLTQLTFRMMVSRYTDIVQRDKPIGNVFLMLLCTVFLNFLWTRKSWVEISHSYSRSLFFILYLKTSIYSDSKWIVP